MCDPDDVRTKTKQPTSQTTMQHVHARPHARRVLCAQFSNRKILLKIFCTFVDTLHTPAQQDEGVSTFLGNPLDQTHHNMSKSTPHRRKPKPDWKDCVIIKKSRVEVDESTFGKGVDTGLGEFTRRSNDWLKINFKGPNTVSILTTDCTDKQKKCQLDSGFDEDHRIVLSRQSLLIGFVDFYFFINHNSNNPTHELIWNDDDGVGFPQLSPLRQLRRDEEITFDYDYE